MIVSDQTAARIRELGRRYLPWILLVAVLANIGITARFQSGTSHSIRISDGAALADLVDSTYPEMRQEYGVYAELARFAYGTTVSLPATHPLDTDRLEFLAGLTVVEGESYPDEIADLLSPTVSGSMIVADRLIRYSLVAGEDDEIYGAILTPELVLLAPIRLLESAGSG